MKPPRSLTMALLAGLLLPLATLAFTRGTVLNGDQIMEQVVQRHVAETEAALVQMVLIDPDGNAEQRRFVTVIRRSDVGLPHFLLRFLAPESISGVTVLAVPSEQDLNQFLYLPAVGRARQITGENRAGYFMGSDFTFGDLHEEDLRDFEYFRMLDGNMDGEQVYQVMAAPANVDILVETGYAHRILFIEKENYLIRKVEFFAEGSTEPIKTLEAERFSTGDGPRRPGRLTMRNHERGTTTVMTLQGSAVNLDVPLDWFDPASLHDWDEAEAAVLAALEPL